MSDYRQNYTPTDPYERTRDRGLACAIGALLAWALVAWWG